MVHAIASHIRFFWDYVKANMQTALEYRATFAGQVVSMIINDTMWVAFWWIYFSRFKVLQGGWRIEDVLGLWAITAVAFGICVGCFGNLLYIAEIISRGGLDYYLVLPKNPLLHLLVSRMEMSGWGDLIFGTAVFIIFLRPAGERILLFLWLAVCSAVVFLAFNILWQSLAFWLGNAEGLASQLWQALITFSTYPASLFQGLVKMVLFTAIPAAFIAYIPVELLRSFDPLWFFVELGVAVLFLALALTVFYRGLRRYESGNLMAART